MSFSANFTALSLRGGEVRAAHPVAVLASVKMRLSDLEGKEIAADIYGKVISLLQSAHADFYVHFTSVPPEVQEFLHGLVSAEGAL
jgi:hypothetical protein